MNFLITKILPDNLVSDPDPVPNHTALHKLYLNRNKKIIAIRSSKGFGKSVLLSHFVSQYSLRYSYYKLDAEDDNLFGFLNYIIHSIDNSVPGFLKEIEELLLFNKSTFIKKEAPSRKAIILFANAVINHLYLKIKESFYIILDDAGNISQYTSARIFLDHLIENSAANIHFILTSSDELPLDQVKFKLKGNYSELTNKDLYAGSDVIKKIAKHYYLLELSGKDAALIEERTGGWMTGIHIFLQSMSSNIDTPSDNNLSEIMEYFFENEILNKLDNKLIKPLILSSLLERLNTDLLSFLFKGAGFASLLTILRTKYGFIIKENGAGEYEYLAFFKEFLLNRSEKLYGDKAIKEIYSSAGNYFLKHKDIFSGVRYLVLSGDIKKVVPVFLQNLPELNRNGDLDVADIWLKTIPENSKEHVPILHYFRGLVYKNYYQNFPDAISSFESYLRSVKENKTEYFIRAACHVAEIRFNMGQSKAAINYLEKLRPAVKQGKQSALLLYRLSCCYLYSNDLIKARLVCREALDFISKSKDAESVSTKASLLNNLGNIQYMNGEYSEAKSYYEKALKDISIPLHRIQTKIMYCYVNLYLGDFKSSKDSLDKLSNEIIIRAIPTLKMQVQEAYANYYLETGLFDKCIAESLKLIEFSEQFENKRFEVTALTIQCKAYYYINDLQGLKKCLLKINKIRGSGPENDLMLADILSAAINKDHLKAVKCFNYFNDNRVISDKIYSLFLLSEIEMKKKNKNELVKYFSDAVSESVKAQNYNALANEFKCRRELFDNAISAGYDKDNMISIYSLIISRIEEGYFDEEEFRISDISLITSGVPSVYVRGEKVADKEWKRNKFKEMFIYLFINRNNYATKDVLIDEFFPGADTAYSDNIFHQFLSTLRSIFHKRKGIEYIRYENKMFSFNDAYLYYSDYQKYNELNKRINSLKDENPLKEVILKKSIDLYQDTFMKGYYTTWAEDMRSRVDSINLKFTKNLIKILELKNDSEGILKYYEHLLKDDDLNEEINFRIIELYAKAGDINTAKIKYRIMLDRFKKELGEEPSAQFLNKVKDVLLY